MDVLVLYNTRVEAVLFDFGGTLDADGTTWLDRFYPLYKEAGVDVPRDRFARAFYDSDDGLPERFPLKGLSLEETLRFQVGDVLKAIAPDRGERTDAIVSRFLEDCRRHFRRNKPVLERLARRHRLGIVSNFYGNLDGVLRSEGLRDLFKTVADSGVIGAIKPEAGIFLHALEELGSSAGQCVMVGDSIPRDMRGAENLRMAHAHLCAAPQERCCGAAWTLRSLPELESILA